MYVRKGRRLGSCLGELSSGERYTAISVVRRLRYSNERTGVSANGHIGD